MKLLVSTKRGLTRHRRCNQEFTPEPIVVDSAELAASWSEQTKAPKTEADVEKALATDDTLNVMRVADDHKLGTMPTLDTAAVVKLEAEGKAKDETIAKLEAELASVKAKLAKLTPSTGERERTGKEK